jgi:phosphoglycolate phosphatase
MIRWISIDLDGTLLDTAVDLHEACQAMLAELGRPPQSMADTRRFVGKGMRVLIDRCLDGEGLTAPEVLDAGVDVFRRHYTRENGRQAKAYPGVFEGLDEMRALKLKLAVVTNKPIAFTEPLLSLTGMRSYFDQVIGGDSLPERKPHPAQILHTCNKFGAAPLSGVHIGDSRNDMEAAHAAGCRYFHVPYGYAEGAPVQDVDMREGDALVSSLVDAARRVGEINRLSVSRA